MTGQKEKYIGRIMLGTVILTFAGSALFILYTIAVLLSNPVGFLASLGGGLLLLLAVAYTVGAIFENLDTGKR